MSYHLESGLTNQQRSEAVAADAQQAKWERARRINMPVATVAYADLHIALAERTLRFAQTYCSQCGCDLGPGESGMSSCKGHIKLQTLGTLYAEFKSETLGFDVRLGYEWDGPVYHAHNPQTSGTELTEVWVLGEEIGFRFTAETMGFLHKELTANLIAKSTWEWAA